MATAFGKYYVVDNLTTLRKVLTNNQLVIPMWWPVGRSTTTGSSCNWCWTGIPFDQGYPCTISIHPYSILLVWTQTPIHKMTTIGVI
jgi:hypothetical protein